MKIIKRMHVLRKPLKRSRDEELGASLIVALFMLVLMFTVFGLAFDIMRNTWLRASLNNELDIAVAAAAAKVYVTRNGQINIDREEANRIVRETYAAARKNYGGLQCNPEPDKPEVCWTEMDRGGLTFNGDTVTYEIIDFSNNFWWQFWKTDDQPGWDAASQHYILESSAVLRKVDEQNFGN